MELPYSLSIAIFARNKVQEFSISINFWLFSARIGSDPKNIIPFVHQIWFSTKNYGFSEFFFCSKWRASKVEYNSGLDKMTREWFKKINFLSEFTLVLVFKGKGFQGWGCSRVGVFTGKGLWGVSRFLRVRASEVWECLKVRYRGDSMILDFIGLRTLLFMGHLLK